MTIGTTPTHTFTVPFEVVGAQAVQVTYKQGEVKLTKQMEDLTITSGETSTIELPLTQEETFKFNTRKKIQIRIVALDGACYASNVVELTPEQCLDSNILPLE